MPTLTELLAEVDKANAAGKAGPMLAGMDHYQLYALRDIAKRQDLQDLLAAYEHRAYAREAVGDNPLMALSIATAAPLYQIGKLTGMVPGRSSPSLSQLGQGLTGVGEGLMRYIRK